MKPSLVAMVLLASITFQCGKSSQESTENPAMDTSLPTTQNPPLAREESQPFLDDCDRLIPNDLVRELTGLEPSVGLPEHWTKESTFECGRVYRLKEGAKSYFSVIYYEHVLEQDAKVRLDGIRGQSTFQHEVKDLGEEALYNERTGPVESLTYSFRRDKIVYFVTNHYRADIPSEINPLTKESLLKLAKGIDAYYVGK
jgi:hypothetical protein